jgi:DNA gyrase subunit B
MDDLTGPQQNTTHDWAIAVDAGHLARIRREPAAFAPGGVRHLVLEVVAYAADEAEASGGGRCAVTFCRDGSVSVSDDGRGTGTRRDGRGRAVKKPVISTKDLRFFDSSGAQLLPDGHPRRGISVVAALSEWLVHATVHFRPDETVRARGTHGVLDALQLAVSWPELLVEICHEQDSITSTGANYRSPGAI